MSALPATAAPPTVRFQDLGTLLVERAGESRPLGGARLDRILAILLVHADERVAEESVAAAVWGMDSAPRTSSTLDTHLWRLRKVLEPDRPRGAPSSLLLSDHGGYRLVARTDQVDSLRLEQLADETGELLGAGSPERALARAEEALALWRGRPFTPLSDEPWAAAAVARLEETHSRVAERHVEALLALGQPDRALVELERMLAETPLREGLWAHRMTAYHLLGRPDDALGSYQRVRALLDEELGVEPGAELRELHTRILNDDPALRAPRRETAAVPEPVVRLPFRGSPLVGRGGELARLSELVVSRPLTTLVGAAGCGKTRLAVEAARQAASAFPNGVWFVDLAGAVDAAGVLDAVSSVAGIGVPVSGSARDAVALFARGRRMLLVLDNCEHVLDAVADLVEALLGQGPEPAVLATSREPLEVDGEWVESLHPLALPVADDPDPATAAAVALFLSRLPRAHTAADLAPAVRIAAAVDGVPLALELAAARHRAYSLDEIAEQVSADPSALSRIGRGGEGRHLTVRDAIHGSYRLLPAPEAHLHRRLCAVPGPFTADLARGLVEGTPAERDLTDHLTRLVHRSLLVPAGAARPGGTSRFGQLATVRGHATHAAGAERETAVLRRDAWVARLVRARPLVGTAPERAWWEAVDDDLAALRATLQHTLVEAPSPIGIAVVPDLARYWYSRAMAVEARRWLESANAVRAVGDPLESALVQVTLGTVHLMQNRPDLGLPHVDAGLAALDTVRDPDPARAVDGTAFLPGYFLVVGALDRIGPTAARLRRIADAHRGEPGLAEHLDLSALTAELTQRLATEPPSAELLAGWARLYDRAREVPNSSVMWTAALRASLLCLALGLIGEGLRWSQAFIDIQIANGERHAAAAFAVRANLLAAGGDAYEAVRLFTATRTHHQSVGIRWPRDDLTRSLHERATGALARHQVDRARAEGRHLTLADLAP